jgi:hypothetical protein
MAAGDIPDPSEDGITDWQHVLIPGDGEEQSVGDREVAIVEGVYLRGRLP